MVSKSAAGGVVRGVGEAGDMDKNVVDLVLDVFEEAKRAVWSMMGVQVRNLPFYFCPIRFSRSVDLFRNNKSYTALLLSLYFH
jgi:hypothetical protein